MFRHDARFDSRRGECRRMSPAEDSRSRAGWAVSISHCYHSVYMDGRVARRLDLRLPGTFSQEGRRRDTNGSSSGRSADLGRGDVCGRRARAQADASSRRRRCVQTLDGQYVRRWPSRPATAPRCGRRATPAAPAAQRRAAAPRQTVYRTRRAGAGAGGRRDEAEPRRSWQKTALIIGGAAASGAGVGAIVEGKKGALIGAAIGGGAASIYEATRRR